MSRRKIVNLLDDFGLGGVTNGLKVFDHPAIAAIAACETLAVDPHALLAPRLDADDILVHFPPRWKGLAFLASLRLRNPRARIIHVEHSYSRDWEQLHVASPKRFRRLLRLAFSLSDHLVCVSRAQADWLLDCGAVSEDRLTVIYPYSRDQGLQNVPRLDQASRGRITVGSYGRFHEAKGYDRLIQAFLRMDDADDMELVLGGMGPMQHALEAMAGSSPRIRFVGQVRDTAAFMTGCHVFAVPSRYETFGQVATEAREAGRPLLVANVGGLPEQVGEAGIIVNCDDPDELLASLRALRCMPLEQMGQAGKAVVARCIERRINAWADLLSGPRVALG